MFVACVREVGEREGSCWQLGATRKFTATSRVVKGKINTTDTRGAECGLGTAIQAHCSDQVPAELMGLTASRVREREREEGEAGQRLRPASVLLRFAGRMLMRSNAFGGKSTNVCKSRFFSGSVWRSAG